VKLPDKITVIYCQSLGGKAWKWRTLIVGEIGELYQFCNF